MVLLESQTLELGIPLQAFELPNANGQGIFSSRDLTKDTVLVAFICNHCPYVVRIVKDFSALAKKYQDQVEFVAISANDPDYTEEDSFDNMKIFAKEHGFIFPYLFDESQEIAKAYKAVCTPDIFVFHRGGVSEPRKLVYHGKFEDLDKAFQDIIKQGKVSFEQLPSCGCSIKWRAN
jgi:peroxiredoxin